MHWASAVSEQFSLPDAVAEAALKVKEGLGGREPDLAVVFVSAHHSPEYEDIPAMVRRALGPRLLVGCSAGGVIGGGCEVEDRAAFSLTAANLPDVTLVPFVAKEESLPDLDARPAAWEQLVGVAADKEPQFVVLPDPFTLRADHLIAGLDYAFPGGIKIGGLSSGGETAGANALFVGDRVLREGAVGLAMYGNIRVDTVVAQGCRPVGTPLVVTRCERNVLLELGGRGPMDVLREIHAASDHRDRQLLTRALHLGVVMDSLKEQVGPGDFLIRNVLGLHQESGGLVVGEVLREGQMVQFHVRDAQTASEDLQVSLRQYAAGRRLAPGSGALLFSCLGRGRHLFGRPDHDTGMFLKEVGGIPLGGFFCNGEIGRVGPATFLHGFTSSFGIFQPRDG